MDDQRVLTHDQIEAYTRNSAVCPWCGAAELVKHKASDTDDTVWRDVRCRACGRSWRDVYGLVGIDAERQEMIAEAVAQERDPDRDRMVIQLSVRRYVATHRWEINRANGWVTVQLRDGSILPKPYGQWCPESYALDYFGISQGVIGIDDPRTLGSLRPCPMDEPIVIARCPEQD